MFWSATAGSSPASPSRKVCVELRHWPEDVASPPELAATSSHWLTTCCTDSVGIAALGSTTAVFCAKAGMATAAIAKAKTICAW